MADRWRKSYSEKPEIGRVRASCDFNVYRVISLVKNPKQTYKELVVKADSAFTDDEQAKRFEFFSFSGNFLISDSA